MNVWPRWLLVLQVAYLIVWCVAVSLEAGWW